MAELTISADEITAALRTNLEGWSPEVERETVGYVTSIADGVARVRGLPRVMASELLEFSDGLIGVTLNIDEEDLGVVVMGDASHIDEGAPVRQTGNVSLHPGGRRPARPGRSIHWETRSTARAPSTPPSGDCSKPRPLRWWSASR